jgi:hypothetical protein
VSWRGFNARYNREINNGSDRRGPDAARMCLERWGMPVVSHVGYLPTADRTFELDGRRWANLYSAASVPALDDCPAAVTLIVEHLRRMLPDDRERELLISWLAHNVRFPGRKIRWAPYLHGPEGDGKSSMIELLAATMGAPNVRPVSSRTLESDFTDWAHGCAVICVEEMRQIGHSRFDVMNNLKPYITNSVVEIHPKGKAAFSAPNTANYLLLSNHLDGAPIGDGDRRFMFLSSAIDASMARKLSADGFFARLHDVLTQHPGALRRWLLEWPLSPEFDANGRAPATELKRMVIELSRSETELAARDALEQGSRGVHPKVVSSWHLARRLRAELGEDARVSTTQLNSLLARMGYQLLGREFWDGRKRMIWVSGGLTWPDARRLLEETR